jgi:PiT family inorganic phosphate transporter
MEPLLIILIVLALGFDFLNGVHDSSNIVATMISSRALPPRLAMTITAVAEFCGPFIFGVAVATTIGDEIIVTGAIDNSTLIVALVAALVAAIFWNLFTWFMGFPSSSSHALIGGLIGAVVMCSGWNSIRLQGVEKVLLTLLTSPFIGLIVGFLITRLIMLASWNATPKVNGFFKKGQVVTAIALALSHGANDAQKSMGIITLALLTTGMISSFQVPPLVIFLCASMIALGTSVGGWKLIKTLGAKFYRIRPIDGFSTQITAAVVILSASLIGGPVSTTQVVSSAIMGVGSAERVNKVRWGVMKEIATAWLLTIPITGIIGAGTFWLISHFIK